MLKKSLLFTLSLVLALIAFQFDLSSASALPPDLPAKPTAQTQLNSLSVQNESSMSGYSREKFPHWISQGDGCDTRQVVLKRDADSYSGNCPVTSGKWYSYYDGITINDPSGLDVDHVVPLAEAWRSGASSWTTAKREDFANDLSGPQLIAVSASSNRSKGDQDPSTWQPPRSGAKCAYAKMWINTKYNWNLHLQSAEKTALQGMLNSCSY